MVNPIFTENMFMRVYEAQTRDSGKVMARRSPALFRSMLNPAEATITTVPIVEVHLPKDKYERFLSDYQNYLDILNQIEDPVIAHELHKLLVLIRLKK
jgi:hypothetical protein